MSATTSREAIESARSRSHPVGAARRRTRRRDPGRHSRLPAHHRQPAPIQDALRRPGARHPARATGRLPTARRTRARPARRSQRRPRPRPRVRRARGARPDRRAHWTARRGRDPRRPALLPGRVRDPHRPKRTRDAHAGLPTPAGSPPGGLRPHCAPGADAADRSARLQPHLLALRGLHRAHPRRVRHLRRARLPPATPPRRLRRDGPRRARRTRLRLALRPDRAAW